MFSNNPAPVIRQFHRTALKPDYQNEYNIQPENLKYLTNNIIMDPITRRHLMEWNRVSIADGNEDETDETPRRQKL
eukprot:UN27679